MSLFVCLRRMFLFYFNFAVKQNVVVVDVVVVQQLRVVAGCVISHWKRKELP